MNGYLSMQKALFIAIGVHKAQGMPVLDGVLKGIDDLTNWAQKSEYDVIKIDDAQKKVDIDRIRDCLLPLEDGERSPTILLDRPRVVVYFCGHGLHAPQDQYWILSAGLNQPEERISAVGFRDTLATYGPKQIAFISDACRSALVVTGQGRSVINSYEADVGYPQKDIFFSSRDGTASFAIPAKNNQPAYCVFSETLYKALKEPDGDNLDEMYLENGRKVVTSQSLANYLENHVPDMALGAGKTQAPQCDSGFRPLINVYTEFIDGTESVPRDLTSLPNINQTAFINYSTRLSQSQQPKRAHYSRSEWRAPFVEEVQNFIRSSVTSPFYGQLGPVLVVSDKWPILLGKHAYESSNGWMRPNPFPKISMWQWFFEPNGFFKTDNSNVVIANVGELYAPIPLFNDLWCAVVFKENSEQHDDYKTLGGVDLLAWGEQYDDRYPSNERILRGELHATEALKGLSDGTLNSSDIKLFTQNLRISKHADPMLGIVSAYLYNGIGDIDNIRRMCYYYHHYNQDVPFDIAMLAGVQFKRNIKKDCFTITVPEVREKPENHRVKDEPRFTWKYTPSVTVNVAGVTPILRVGWQHIQNSKHRIHRQCWDLVDHMTEAPISTFIGLDAGKSLIKAFKEF